MDDASNKPPTEQEIISNHTTALADVIGQSLDAIARILGKHYCFALFVFEADQQQSAPLTYSTNAQRADLRNRLQGFMCLTDESELRQCERPAPDRMN